jgi:hypothetical protein
MCQCRERIDKRLAERNARIASGFTIDLTKPAASMSFAPPLIHLEKVDRKKRGTLPMLVASYCPFCGEKIPD